jgi:hypothetical protein
MRACETAAGRYSPVVRRQWLVSTTGLLVTCVAVLVVAPAASLAPLASPVTFAVLAISSHFSEYIPCDLGAIVLMWCCAVETPFHS